MPQQDFEKSSAQNRGLGGDVRLKSGESLLLFLLLQEYRKRRPGLDRQGTTIENVLPQERYQLWSWICVVYHVLRRSTRGDNGVYLHRAAPRLLPWGTGVVYRVTAVRPVRYNEKRRGMVVGSEATSLLPCHMFSNKAPFGLPPTHWLVATVV